MPGAVCCAAGPEGGMAGWLAGDDCCANRGMLARAKRAVASSGRFFMKIPPLILDAASVCQVSKPSVHPPGGDAAARFLIVCMFCAKRGISYTWLQAVEFELVGRTILPAIVLMAVAAKGILCSIG